MATATARNTNCNNINIANNQNITFLNNNSNNLNSINMNIMNMNINNKQDDHYLFEYIYDLYVNQLYQDVIQTVRFFDNNLQRFRETFGITHGLNVLFFYGISLYHTHEYKLALQIFQQASTYYSDHFTLLSSTKNIENVNSRENHNVTVSINKNNTASATINGNNNNNNNNSNNSNSNIMNGNNNGTGGGGGIGGVGNNNNSVSVKRKTIGENSIPGGQLNGNESSIFQGQLFGQSPFTIVEMKYQIHLCYKKLGDNQSAINTLQSISRESQTLKTLLALGDLCLETNNYREALICYKNAVFKNPLAFCTLKKYLNHANEKRAEEFVHLLSRKIDSKLCQNMAELFKEYIRAQKLARHPKNFKQVSQLYFDLGKGLKTSPPSSGTCTAAAATTTTPTTTSSSPSQSTVNGVTVSATGPTSLIVQNTNTVPIYTGRKPISGSAGNGNTHSVLASNQQSIVQSLQLKPMTYDNMYLMLDAARNLYYDGYISNANFLFQKIYSANRNLIEGTDCWASCLYRDVKYKQLSQLTCDIIAMCSATNVSRVRRPQNNNSSTNSNSSFNNNSGISSGNNNNSETTLCTTLTGHGGDMLNLSQSNSIMTNRPEPWIVIGFYTLSKRDPKAIMFANKALTIDNSSEEAMILKTLIYNRNLVKDNGNFIEEIRQFIYKIKNQKTYIRFEFLKYLAEAVLEKEGRDAAEIYVKQAIDRFGMSTRICTFYCALIHSDRKASIAERERALNMLEESVKNTPFYMSAAVNLVKFYTRDGEDEKAIPLLEKLLEKFNYEFLHTMLIECYERVGLHEKADIHKINCLRGNRGGDYDYRLTKLKNRDDSINETLSELDLTNVSSISTYDDVHDNSFDRFTN